MAHRYLQRLAGEAIDANRIPLRPVTKREAGPLQVTPWGPAFLAFGSTPVTTLVCSAFDLLRITHLPTGIVVQCQNERSQHKNRATAWAMLRARLYEAELQRREEQAQAEAAAKSEIGWGHQIRSYVLQPYQMVKDLRTGVESSNPNAVLDGDIDAFIEAALAQRVEGETSAQIQDLE